MTTEQEIAIAKASVDKAFQPARSLAAKAGPDYELEICRRALRGLDDVLSLVRKHVGSAAAALDEMDRQDGLIDKLTGLGVSVEGMDGEWHDFDGSCLSEPLDELRKAVAKACKALEDAEGCVELASDDMDAIFSDE